MCATCGCGDPKNKHGKKTLKDANKAGAKKAPAKKAADKKDDKKMPAFLMKKDDKKKGKK
jgi:hypothetical protein